MPCINIQIQASGPLITAFIGVSAPRGHALIAAGQQPPAPVMGTFLIDTGASCTCVDNDLIAQLNLQPTGRAAISTPSTPAGTPHGCDLYDISLFIPGNAVPGTATPVSGHVVTALPVVTTHLRSQGIEGLIGRDVLNSCTLIYNGTCSMYSLCY